jgi:hypothetical protein
MSWELISQQRSPTNEIKLLNPLNRVYCFIVSLTVYLLDNGPPFIACQINEGLIH